MYCPECGTDAGDAKFCPECGTDLGVLKKTLRGDQTAGKPAGPAAQQRKSLKQTGVSAAEGPGRKPGQLGPRKQTGGAGTRPWVIWSIVAAVVVPIVLIVSITLATSHKGSSASQTPAPVADTSGTYAELVQRANALSDQALKAVSANDMVTGQAYGQAAATVYSAAWKKQPGDPSVGTDWAIALFYSGDFQGAISRVEKVLAANPTFQKGWFNAGIFYKHVSQMTQDKALVKADVAKARTAFTKAVALNPSNDVGRQAQQALQQLPK